MGANFDYIRVLEETKITVAGESGSKTTRDIFSLKRDIEQLRHAVTKVPNCKLIIIDPISSYLEGVDTHKDAASRSALRPLAKLADDKNVAIICISHLNKNEGWQCKTSYDRQCCFYCIWAFSMVRLRRQRGQQRGAAFYVIN